MDDDLLLVKRIRNHEENAFEELLDKYRNMIYSIINQFDLQTGDFFLDEQEFFQEGCVGLYKAALSYEGSKDVKFSTFVYSVILKRINTYYRDSKRKTHGLASLDAMGKSVDYYLGFIANDSTIEYMKERRTIEMIGDFLNTINETDRAVLTLRQAKYSYKEIADILNVSTKYVDNHIRMTRRKLKAYLASIEVL